MATFSEREERHQHRGGLVPLRSLARTDLRARVVSAGVALFTGQPYGAVTIQAVLRTAGITAAQFQSLFKSKQRFVLAVAQRAADEMELRLSEIALMGNAEAAIRALLVAQARTISMRRSAFVEEIPSTPGFDDELWRLRDKVRALRVELLCDILRVTSRPPELMALLTAWLAFFDELLVATQAMPHLTLEHAVGTSVSTLHSLLQNYAFLSPSKRLTKREEAARQESERRAKGQPPTGRRPHVKKAPRAPKA